MNNAWRKLERSERATIGRFECDIWRTGEGARYSVLDTNTGRYIKGGKCADLEWARQVSEGFARTISELSAAFQNSVQGE